MYVFKRFVVEVAIFLLIAIFIYLAFPQVLSGTALAQIDSILGIRKIHLYGLTTHERLKESEDFAAPYGLKVVEGGCVVGTEEFYEDMAYNARVISGLPEDKRVEFSQRFVGQVFR